jgi:probable rRNA maturation factor
VIHPPRQVDEEGAGSSEAAPEIHLAAPGGEPLPEALLLEALGAVLAGAGIRTGELSVTFLADGPIRALNHEWLAHDWVPDVLAFELAPPLLGDVYVGLEQAARQAGEHGIPLEEELVRLAVHGTLHLVGYDHPEEPEARASSRQYQVQEVIVRRVMAGSGTADAPTEGGEE